MRQTFAFFGIYKLSYWCYLCYHAIRLVLTARESAPESVWLHSESGRGQNSAQE